METTKLYMNVSATAEPRYDEGSLNVWGLVAVIVFVYPHYRFVEGSLNVWGLVTVIVFYLVILLVGVYASYRKKSMSSANTEDVMLAGRDIGLFVGIFTMTATWVGGGYINGTAEKVYSKGLVWVQAPIGYSISLTLGGLLFAKQMRSAGYVTMLDPFEQRYGSVMAGLLYIPALMGESFWSASILSALGASLAVILNLGHGISIIISAGVAIIYTVVGGLFSVAFTDIIQLICIFVGLWLGVGFALANPLVEPLGETMHQNPSFWYGLDANATTYTWLGHLELDYGLGRYLDAALHIVFGGIPWQAYFQRVLSARTSKGAQQLSFVASFGCLFMAVPAIILGAVARSADWSATAYPGELPIPKESHALVLPLVLQYLTPTPVAVIGLGAVSAAAMSSTDSSILSAASMFARNIYKPIRNAIYRKSQATESEVIWAMRVGIILVGCMSTLVAIYVTSIYGLFHLCSDLVYVCLFPQLLTVVYMPKANIYGSAAGLFVGLVLRVTGGEPLIRFPPAIYYPWWHEEEGVIYQNFPFKTLAMIISTLVIIGVSYATHYAFTSGLISPSKDIWNGVVHNGSDGGYKSELDDMLSKQNKIDIFDRDTKGDHIWVDKLSGKKVNPSQNKDECSRLKWNSESDDACI